MSFLFIFFFSSLPSFFFFFPSFSSSFSFFLPAATQPAPAIAQPTSTASIPSATSANQIRQHATSLTRPDLRCNPRATQIQLQPPLPPPKPTRKPLSSPHVHHCTAHIRHTTSQSSFPRPFAQPYAILLTLPCPAHPPNQLHPSAASKPPTFVTLSREKTKTHTSATTSTFRLVQQNTFG